ncbi:MAG: exo-alpha-sialidase [Verrucomicrobia bacterium]|nr:exo-alpha-sialidase [Verrucomicrobiota bacterium]
MMPQAIAGALAVAHAGGAPLIDHAPLFTSGQDGYSTYRIPAIVRTQNGTLLAFCEGRKNSSSDTGDIDLLVRRSTDNGDTWSAQQIVWSDGSNTCGNPAPVVDPASGAIRLLSTWNLGTDNESSIVAGTSADTRRVFLISSTDDGLTWSTASEITATAKQSAWAWYATGPGAGIALTRGNQAGRLIVPCDHIRSDNKAFGSHVIYSDDGGSTWQIGAVAVTTPTVKPNENLAVELVATAPDGGSRIFFNARDHLGTHTRATTFSNDGGLTYTPSDFTDAPQFVCPVVQGGLARFHATDTGDSNNRILFSCPNGNSRNRISVWSSSDEGITWSTPKAIHEGPSAYSDMVRLTEDRMAMLYEKGTSSAYETITLTRFNVEWLDQPAPPAERPGAAFWNFEETAPGGTCSTATGAIRDVHPDENGMHMTATKPFPVTVGAPSHGSGRALSFSGDGGIRILDSDSANRFDFGPNHSFTIEVVCRIPSGSTQIGSLVAKDLAATSPSWWLRVENGKARFLISDNTVERVFYSAATINDGQWHHIAAVRDATVPANKQLRLYIDGTLSGSLADTTVNTLANGQAVWVGRYNAGTRYLTGEVDMVRITPSALQPAAFLATFDQFDADRDGIPDGDERSLTGITTVLGTGDADGDGRTDLLEYVFGTNPSASDPTAITASLLSDDSFEIRTRLRELPAWISLDLLSSTDLTAWTPIDSVKTVTDIGSGISERVDTVDLTGYPLSKGFFRYRIINTR